VCTQDVHIRSILSSGGVSMRELKVRDMGAVASFQAPFDQDPRSHCRRLETPGERNRQ